MSKDLIETAKELFTERQKEKDGSNKNGSAPLAKKRDLKAEDKFGVKTEGGLKRGSGPPSY